MWYLLYSTGVTTNNEGTEHNGSDIKRAIGIYHSELSRLQEKDGSIDERKSSIPTLTPSPSSLENSTISANNVAITDKEVDCVERSVETESESIKSSHMNHCKPNTPLSTISQNIQLVPPSKLLQSPNTPPMTDFSLALSSTHPLQQIASITNSLHGKPQPNLTFP